MTATNRLMKLEARREAKFKKHEVRIEPASGSSHQHFIYCDGKLEATVHSYRMALKRGHQMCRNHAKFGYYFDPSIDARKAERELLDRIEAGEPSKAAKKPRKKPAS
jgi:hypothetical protein